LTDLALLFANLLTTDRRYNSLLTGMLLGKEWNDYAYERKTLRVHSPTGKQRSTYYLQLPYRYGIPLLIAATLLHWLTSQAIFLDRRIVRQVWWGDPYNNNSVGSVSTVGYSPMATIFCLGVGIIMLAALIVIGLRRYKSAMPLAGSCSAAISAACHSPPSDADASFLPLKWGVIEVGDASGVGHCSFSSRDVSEPVTGLRYAG
jgi:hypothetical protein